MTSIFVDCAHIQCSRTSVGLTQAHPNHIQLYSNLSVYTKLTGHKLWFFFPSDDSPTLCCFKRPVWHIAIPCWSRS